ncbi:MAG: anhydro-N-acetylmuramic acid kinase, partial [Pseudomonadota bacterium]
CMANLRHNDMCHGGQGAPLVPAYHAALAAQLPGDEPVAVVNVGGVANITWLPAGDLATKLAGMRAFDVGPGNALIDEFVCAHTSALFDQDGAIAAQGSVDHSALEACLQHPFFLAPAPKSLDRRDFHRLPAVQMLLRSGDLHTGAATLIALTAHAIALSELHTPGGPGATARWIITGGGARNATLLRQLSALLNAGSTARGRTVQTADALGWSSAHLEAEAFAYLAVRARQHLPLTWPGSTGVIAPVTGGQIFPLS